MVISEEEFNHIVYSTTEQILLFNIQHLLNDSEDKIFGSLARKEYEEAEKYLSELCFNVLDMPDKDHTFLMKIYFTSIVTEIIRLYTRTNRLHPERLAYSQALIIVIESWENISEYILSIPWFIDKLKNKLIANTSFLTGSPHVEKALTLITLNIEQKHLTVNWLASQLNISTTHLSNLFKLHVGETLTKYIKSKRMDQIIFDLKYTNLSLKKVRLKYGFENQSHFIQYFKRAEGKTPLVYKQDLI